MAGVSSTVLRVVAVVSILLFLLMLLLYRRTSFTPLVLPLPFAKQTQGTSDADLNSGEVSSRNGSKLIYLPITQEFPKVSKTVSQRPYLFFVSITEQLSQNTLKYIQLCYFGALWNLSVIEPSIYRSSEFLSSLPPVSEVNMLPFLDLYNVTAVEERLTKCFKPNLPKVRQKEFKFHKMDEALIHSPREILIVRFMEKRWSEKVRWSCGECDGISSGVKKTVLHALNTRVHKVKETAMEVHGEEYAFQVWRTLCIDAIKGVPFSFLNASNCIQKHLDEKRKRGNPGVSVVVDRWKKVVTTYSDWYYYCPQFTFNRSYCQNDALPYTPLVLSTAKKMQQNYNLLECRYIGVYVRTERIAKQEHKDPGMLKRCFDQLMTKLNTSRVLYDIPLSNVVLVHDAGKYGSHSFGYYNAMPRAKTLLEMFKSHKIRTVYYDPKGRKEVPQHRAFVASVEQEFLSHSYVLMTMGSGGFLNNVKKRFLASHNKDRLYVICNKYVT